MGTDCPFFCYLGGVSSLSTSAATSARPHPDLCSFSCCQLANLETSAAWPLNGVWSLLSVQSCICEKGPGFICAEAPCGRLTRTISAFRHETPSAIFNHSVPPWDHASLGSFAPCRVHGLRPSSSGGDSVFLCAFLLLWSRCGLVAWSGAVGKAPGLHGGSLSPQRKAWLYTLAARHL